MSVDTQAVILAVLKGVDAALAVSEDFPAFQQRYAELKAKLHEFAVAGRDPTSEEWGALDAEVDADLAVINGIAE